MSKATNGRKVKIVGINEYVLEAAKLPQYMWCDDVKQWGAVLHEMSFCWAQGDTVEETRAQLLEVIETWIVASLQSGHEIPVINGVCIGYERKKKNAGPTAAAQRRRQRPMSRRDRALAGAAR